MLHCGCWKLGNLETICVYQFSAYLLIFLSHVCSEPRKSKKNALTVGVNVSCLKAFELFLSSNNQRVEFVPRTKILWPNSWQFTLCHRPSFTHFHCCGNIIRTVSIISSRSLFASRPLSPRRSTWPCLLARNPFEWFNFHQLVQSNGAAERPSNTINLKKISIPLTDFWIERMPHAISIQLCAVVRCVCSVANIKIHSQRFEIASWNVQRATISQLERTSTTS